MTSLCVICPVFREQEGITHFHAALNTVLEGLKDTYCWSILYVVDPADDSTEEILKQIAAADSRVEVLVLSRRFGHQASLLAGLDHCRADAIIMMDSDMQHPPELIPAMLAASEKGADIVQTVRIDGAAIGFFKRTMSHAFYRVLNKMTGVELVPGAADFRLISGQIADIFRTQIRERNQFLRGLFHWIRFTVHYMPFECPPRPYGRSKYTIPIMLNFAVHGICSFSRAPLRFAALVGLVISTLGLVFTLVQVIVYLLSPVTVSGWASLLTTVMVLGGLQILLLGVVGEYIALIFDEVKARPHYLIQRRHGTGAATSEATAPSKGARSIS